MKYIDLTKPHGYLIWKGKQQALVSPILLPTNEKMLVIQEGQEAFGEVVLGHPAQVNISEFERLEEEHATRPEERKLKWPELDKFYLYRFKEWQPYPDSRDVMLDNGNAELLPVIKLSEQEQKLLDQAERLPKTLILKDEAVTLEDGQVVFCEGLDGSKVMPILQATLEDKLVSDSLPLYQLALVRIPRLKLKKNMEDDVKFNSCHDNLGQFCSTGGKIDYEALVNEAYNFTDEKSGLSTKLVKVVKTDEGIKVRGAILDSGGNTVGAFTREIEGTTVLHNVFALEEANQSTGFGTRFFKHSEDVYIKQGIDKIELIANKSVGGYAWARMGFDFSSEKQKDSVVYKLKEVYSRRYGTSPEGIPNTAYGIASFVGPDGFKIGKEALLGSNWEGSKNLNPDSVGYKVGQAYYQSKGLL